jgi:hypothetical protein
MAAICAFETFERSSRIDVKRPSQFGVASQSRPSGGPLGRSGISSTDRRSANPSQQGHYWLELDGPLIVDTHQTDAAASAEAPVDGPARPLLGAW